MHKRCTNGAPAGAPDPLPVDTKPTTPEVVAVGNELVPFSDFVESARWGERTAGRRIRTETGFVGTLANRILGPGPDARDLSTLAAWRKAMSLSRADDERPSWEMLEGERGDFVTPSGTRVRVRDDGARIEKVDGTSEFLVPATFRRKLANGELRLLPLTA